MVGGSKKIPTEKLSEVGTGDVKRGGLNFSKIIPFVLTSTTSDKN